MLFKTTLDHPVNLKNEASVILYCYMYYIIPSTGDIPRLFKSPQEGDLFTTTLETYFFSHGE